MQQLFLAFPNGKPSRNFSLLILDFSRRFFTAPWHFLCVQLSSFRHKHTEGYLVLPKQKAVGKTLHWTIYLWCVYVSLERSLGDFDADFNINSHISMLIAINNSAKAKKIPPFAFGDNLCHFGEWGLFVFFRRPRRPRPVHSYVRR